MHQAVLAAATGADIYIGAAAVGDYRPAHQAEHKLKKQQGKPLVLDLTENADIIADLAKWPGRPFLVAFAAETRELAGYAQDKLARKGVDMVAANEVGGGLGFEAVDNALNVYWPGGSHALPRAPKTELARHFMALVAEHYKKKGSPA
jgi:phosphopantothenoylcysteine decarboxylase/phosphopantothenate--cysteine ligase